MENESRRERERKVRENEIIMAAETIFRQKGYENTSMDDIARGAQFTKRTLYQYFSSKENLFFAVLQKGMAKFQDYLTEGINPDLTGYGKIEQTMEACYRFYLDYPEFFRLMNHVGIARQQMSDPGDSRQSYLNLNDALFQNMARLISAGQADGSIPDDLDASKTSMSLIFLITALFNQLAVTGANFSAHFNMDVKEFNRFTLNMVLRILNNKKQ